MLARHGLSGYSDQPSVGGSDLNKHDRAYLS